MPQTRDEAGTHFVVERLNWRRSRGDTFHRYPGQTRVASFDTAAEAEAFRRAEEAKARAAVNPFAGTLAPPTDQTSMPEGVLCDWLQDHGIDPPTPKKSEKRDWAKWWEKASPRWTADQRAPSGSRSTVSGSSGSVNGRDGRSRMPWCRSSGGTTTSGSTPGPRAGRCRHFTGPGRGPRPRPRGRTPRSGRTWSGCSGVAAGTTRPG